MANTIHTILFILLLLCWLLVIIKLIRNRFAPVKTVPAEVVDTYQTEIVSKSPGVGEKKRYVVVFEANGKRLSFFVSEFSYQSYQKEDKGMLTYKGSQIISFQ